MIHTKRTGWSVHDETMDDLGNNNGEKMAQAVRSGPAQLGQSHVPQALGLQPAPELLEGADWAGGLRSVGGRGDTGDLELEAWGRVEKSYYSLKVVLFCAGRVGRAFVVEGGSRTSFVVGV